VYDTEKIFGELHSETLSWISGVVAPRDGAPLLAPISGKPCVAYEIWAYRVLSGHVVESERADFILERGPERILVRTEALSLERDKLPGTAYWTTGQARSEEALALLARRRRGHGRVMQLVESIVPVGASVRLWGRSRILADPSGEDAGYRTPPRWPVLEARKLELA